VGRRRKIELSQKGGMGGKPSLPSPTWGCPSEASKKTNAERGVKEGLRGEKNYSMTGKRRKGRRVCPMKRILLEWPEGKILFREI